MAALAWSPVWRLPLLAAFATSAAGLRSDLAQTAASAEAQATAADLSVEAGASFPVHLGKLGVALGFGVRSPTAPVLPAQQAAAAAGRGWPGAKDVGWQLADRSPGGGAARLQPLQMAKRGSGSEPERSDNSNLLEEMMAEDYVTGERSEIALPHAWSARMDPTTLFFDSNGPGWTKYSFRLAEDFLKKAVIKILRAKDPSAQREFTFMDRLRYLRKLGECTSGNTVTLYERTKIGDKIFMLMEAEDQTLEGSLTHAKMSQMLTPKNISMPLDKSLPMLIDILRGLCDLEQAGIIHGSLSPDSVIVLKSGRAVVGDLGNACLVHAGDPELSSATLKDEEADEFFKTSPIWQPPEVTDGSPKGPEHHTWAAGMIFATMTFGSNPAEAFLLNTEPEKWPYCFLVSGRVVIRDVLRKFQIQETAKFKSASPDVRKLLSRMLEPDPEVRWSTQEALKKAEELAKNRDIPVPPKRERPRLPGFDLDEVPAAMSSGGASTFGGQSGKSEGERGAERRAADAPRDREAGLNERPEIYHTGPTQPSPPSSAPATGSSVDGGADPWSSDDWQ